MVVRNMEGTQVTGCSNAAPPPFLNKTYDMVDDRATDAVVSWSSNSNSFIVWNPPEFARDLLPKYFKHNNFSSFVRQLNTYGFRKVDPDRWEFANEGFLRGQKHLLRNICRRKPAHNPLPPQQQQSQSPTVGACVEVGKFGLEEEIQRLKRDKNVLMTELVRLRQQQQSTDQQLQTVTQRLQGMEQRQQQMMSFLAKAMQNPAFLAQLLQHNDSNMRISKKRSLPKQDENSRDRKQDGQIIRYQPSLNDSTMMHFSDPESSSKMDSQSNVLDNFMSFGHLTDEASNNEGGNAIVHLNELQATSGLTQSGVSHEVSNNQASLKFPKTSSTSGSHEMAITPSLPKIRTTASVSTQLELSEMQSIVNLNNTGNGHISLGDYVNRENGCDDNNSEADIDLGLDIDTENFFNEENIDSLLSGIGDWQQYAMQASPGSGEAGDPVMKEKSSEDKGKM